MIRALFALVVSLFAMPAFAQCEGTWNNSRLTTELDEMTQRVADSDSDAIRRSMKSLYAGLPCMEELANRTQLARYARLQGFLAFLDQDEESALEWGLYARVIDDSAPWPLELPPTHPYLAMLAEADDPTTVKADGFLVVPDKGGIFVNGAFVSEPEALAQQQNLVQVLDKNGYPKDTGWQDGAAFPSALISDIGEPTSMPKYYDPATHEVKQGAGPVVERIKRDPIDIPVMPIAISGGLAASSAVAYLLAGSAQASLATATTAEDLTRARSTANILVLVSGATAAGALGVGVGGIILSGNGAQYNVRF
jgi:hypothetical protein